MRNSSKNSTPKRRRKIKVDFGGVVAGRTISEREDPGDYDPELLEELKDLYWDHWEAGDR